VNIIVVANGCGKRWCEGRSNYCNMESNAVAEAAVLGMYRTEMVSWSACLSSHVEGWEKRRCLASDAAIRARVE
jgi:hypothetical protein